MHSGSVKLSYLSKVAQSLGRGLTQIEVAALKKRLLVILTDDERLGQKHTRRDLATMLGVDERTIYRWRKEIQKKGLGSLVSQVKRGRKAKGAVGDKGWGDIVGILKRLQLNEKVWLERLKRRSKRVYAYAKRELQRCDDIALIATKLGDRALLYSDDILAEVAEVRVRLLAIRSSADAQCINERDVSPFAENVFDYWSVVQIANFLSTSNRSPENYPHLVRDTVLAFSDDYQREGQRLIDLYNSTVGFKFSWSLAPMEMLHYLRLAKAYGVEDAILVDWLLGDYSVCCRNAALAMVVPTSVDGKSRAEVSMIEYREVLRARSLHSLLTIIQESKDLDARTAWLKCMAIGFVGPDDESGFSVDDCYRIVTKDLG